jgi:septal ring factor EnvC (AmiA/AmiB activator)
MHRHKITLAYRCLWLCCCRLEELLEVKEALQKQLEGAQADLEAAAGQLAESRKKGEALAAQLATAEEAKGLAEKVGGTNITLITLLSTQCDTFM